jgi:transposase
MIRTGSQALRDRAQAERAALETLLRRRDLSPRERERLEMIKAVALGQDQATIAAWSSRSVRTVRRWLARFRREGLAALPDRARSGRPAHADVAYQEALASAVATSPPALGLPFDTWTSARLSAYLAEQTGVQVSPGWLRVLLGRLGFATGQPKHTLTHLQDPEAVAAGREELAATAAKSRRRPRPL